MILLAKSGFSSLKKRARRPLAEEEKSTDAAKARTRAMELLAGQELSSGQLYERLNRRYTQQTSAAVVAEMVQREYINDARYAETRAHALLAAKKSRRAAARNLRQKGLAAGDQLIFLNIQLSDFSKHLVLGDSGNKHSLCGID